jgi:transposase
MSMSNVSRQVEGVVGVVGGVDTHKDSHHAVAIDTAGRLLGERSFAATTRGHRELLDWLRSHGPVERVGIEGTSSYGAPLARLLAGGGLEVIEVNRPSRQTRRAQGKSDRIDAEQAARAVLSATATATPKSKNGPVEAIRTLRITRSTVVKARTQTMNALHAIVVTAPDDLREELVRLRKRTLVNRCARLRPETTDLRSLANHGERLVLAATKASLRDLAQRWLALDQQIKAISTQLDTIVSHAAPELVALQGVGTEIAGQLLITAGDNNDRINHEASFAKLCGVAPQPASSGKTNGRHRLSRSGDRAANSALYLIAITRLRHHEPTRSYVARRTAEGLTKREILRCLKRYIAREIYAALPRPSQTLDQAA